MNWLENPILLPLTTFMLCYVIGSFPTAYLVGRLNRINIFEVGSGNMGATNITRALGLGWGVFVLGVDLGKGILAVMLARLMPGDPVNASVIGAVAAVMGHNWSLLATLLTGKLRGGKGAATAGGTLIMLAPWHLILVTVSLMGAIILLTRYVSLAVLVGVAIAAIWMLILIKQDPAVFPPAYVYYVFAMSGLVYVRFWGNIQRLLQGRERRLGDPA